MNLPDHRLSVALPMARRFGRAAHARLRGRCGPEVSPFLLHLAATLILAAFLSGCAGYQLGNWSLYPPDIRTVYVPMFRSGDFRRNLSEWLTEAVIKEIELKTPYKVVGTAAADSILTGRIVGQQNDLLIENRFDDPRELEVGITIEVQWVDRRGNQLRDGVVPVPPELVNVRGSGLLAPELGHSMATAQQEAIQEIARRIVSMMEAPW